MKTLVNIYEKYGHTRENIHTKKGKTYKQDLQKFKYDFILQKLSVTRGTDLGTKFW